MGQDIATRNDLLEAAAQPLPVDSVVIPQLKKTFWCQGLSSINRSRWERSFVRHNKVDARLIVKARAALLVLCLIDDPESRKRLYGDEDTDQLGKVPAVIIEPLYDMCRKL